MNQVLGQFYFEPEEGKIDLKLKFIGDSVSLVAKLITKEGNVEFSSVFLYKPGEEKAIASGSITSPSDFIS